MYEDPKMARWRKKVTDFIKQNYIGRYFDGAIRTKVTFYMKATKKMQELPKPRSGKKKKDEYARFITETIPYDKKIDLDNLEKSLYDSISKAEIVWKDDCLIVEHTTRKLYSPNPRIEIEIEEFE
ncbi:holliday junction resolvase [Streptococcus phage Javan213]|nr:holliday junction resolvase [Streptococcus phage Javan213]